MASLIIYRNKDVVNLPHEEFEEFERIMQISQCAGGELGKRKQYCAIISKFGDNTIFNNITDVYKIFEELYEYRHEHNPNFYFNLTSEQIAQYLCQWEVTYIEANPTWSKLTTTFDERIANEKEKWILQTAPRSIILTAWCEEDVKNQLRQYNVVKLIKIERIKH